MLETVLEAWDVDAVDFVSTGARKSGAVCGYEHVRWRGGWLGMERSTLESRMMSLLVFASE